MHITNKWRETGQVPTCNFRENIKKKCGLSQHHLTLTPQHQMRVTQYHAYPLCIFLKLNRACFGRDTRIAHRRVLSRDDLARHRADTARQNRRHLTICLARGVSWHLSRACYNKC